jgi:hypothetical protein
MVDILHTVHFTSVETFLLRSLKNDGDVKSPRIIKGIYPNLYWGVDEKKMDIELKQIMDALKLLNVLTHYLYYKQDFVNVLDDAISETLILLAEKVNPRPLCHREAYNAIIVLISCIKVDIIKDRLRPLRKKEINALTFMIHIRDIIAHNILQKEQDPYNNGQLY